MHSADAISRTTILLQCSAVPCPSVLSNFSTNSSWRHACHLVSHHLILLIDSLTEPPILLGLGHFTLQCTLRVVLLRSLQHFQLLRSILDPTLNQVDLVTHQAESSLHLLLHGEDLLTDQIGKGWLGLPTNYWLWIGENWTLIDRVECLESLLVYHCFHCFFAVVLLL